MTMADRVEKPWGWYEIIDNNPVTKILCLKPGGMMSLQSHSRRGETWVPLDTGAIAYVDRNSSAVMAPPTEAILMLHGNTYRININDVHRLINPTDREIKLIEIMHGQYDEDDIIRYQDIYDRNK